MSIILHLSDLHLLSNPGEQEIIFDELVSALRHVREHAGAPIDLLAITGDVFDSAAVDVDMATARFAELHQDMRGALGGDVPTVIVPGNHDRRRHGLFGPHRSELFVALQKRLAQHAWVHGCNTPFLSELVPHSYHRLPMWIVAFDSTYLTRGLVSAGGMLRQEDLLYAAAQMADQHPDWPVLFLLHHHLVPTPLTDLGPVELESAPAIVRWGVQRLLPDLIAHADREELTMTALGAGTALSTLHTLGRSVLAIHGHKHYATARMLDGMSEAHGDVLLVSAGSAGLAQTWHDQSALGDARLWPSFNTISLEGDQLAIDTWSFAWKREGSEKRARRALVRARRAGSQWRVEPLRQVTLEDTGPRLAENAASFVLWPSDSHPGRWDYRCTRELSQAPGPRLRRYVEAVNGLEDGSFIAEQSAKPVKLPIGIHLELGGRTEYQLLGGVFRTLSEAERTLGGRFSPFAHVALMNRYYSEQASLVVRGLGDAAASAFASSTDLGTGLERPMQLTRGDIPGELELPVACCAPRTLLRVYWRLSRT
jgi:3',5'-cyclic AMP phosphodiesterase CpdA